MASVGFSMYSIMPLANSDCFTSFPVWIPFISLSSLIAVTRTSKTVLNNCGKSGHYCLVPDLRGNTFSFSLLKIIFSVYFQYMAFIMLRQDPSMPTFWRLFIINGVEFCQKLFLHLLR